MHKLSESSFLFRLISDLKNDELQLLRNFYLRAEKQLLLLLYNRNNLGGHTHARILAIQENKYRDEMEGFVFAITFTDIDRWATYLPTTIHACTHPVCGWFTNRYRLITFSFFFSVIYDGSTWLVPASLPGAPFFLL